MDADQHQQAMGQMPLNDPPILQHGGQSNFWPQNQPDNQFMQNQGVRFPNNPHHQMLTLLAQPQQTIPIFPAAGCFYYNNNPAQSAPPPPPPNANLQGGHIPPPQNALCCCQRFRHAHPCFAFYFGSGTQPPATNFSGTICQFNPYAHLSPQTSSGHAMDPPHMPNYPGPERARYFEFEQLEIGSFHLSLDPTIDGHIRPRVRVNLSKKRVIYEFTSSFFGHIKEEELSFKSEPPDSDEPIDQTDSEDQQQQQRQERSQQQQHDEEQMPPSHHQSQSEQQQQVQHQTQQRSNTFPQLQVRNFAVLLPIDAITSVFLDANDVYLVIAKAPLIFSSDGHSPNIIYEFTTLNDPSNGQIKCNRLHKIKFIGNGGEKFYSFLLEIEPRLRMFGANQKMVPQKELYFEENGLPEPENA